MKKDGWNKLRVGNHWIHADYPTAVISSVRDGAGWVGYRVTVDKTPIGHFRDWGKAKEAVMLANLGVEVTP